MAHPIYQYSSIARPLEAKFRTNLAVLILLPLIAIGLAGFERFYRAAEFGDAVATGVIGALAAFLAWALTRELDPDRNPGAFVAMALCVAASALGFGPGLFAAAVILMSVRVVVRTVGLPARTTDLALVLVLAAAAAGFTGDWWLCLVPGAAFVIDYLFDRRQRLAPVFAAGALALAALVFVTSGWSWAETDTLVRGWIVAVVTVGGLFALMTVTCPPVTSRCDASNDLLDKRRIQAGMALTLGAAALTLLGGLDSLTASLPVWAAMGGVIEGRAMPKRKI
ncbi:hypothetical protein [Hyphobacterium marinum]|uniref:Uncharacterized protein n=1 Tax=Hyphobacterium marinum TaxID=3116574 RepID=A0ABU7M0B4_9PROT|nr:hypothetical protein [Hyphobacterium sp. Y6023]MEE2567233.1 hypothetical protein [Hyphobacterium sp. Y6023]